MYNVLIIEDEPPILRGICNAIKKCSNDFEVVNTAFNGEEAVSLLKQNHYDLIITDINMPVKDGFYVLSYLKDNNIDSISIILSGYEEFSYAQKALSYNIKDYLVKPIDKERLTNLLKEVSQEIDQKKYFNKQNIFSQLVYQKNSSNNIKLDDSYFMVLICAGSIPRTTDDFMSPGSIYWEKNDIYSIVNKINVIKNYWIINGSSLSEKILIANCNSKNIKSIAYDLFERLSTDDISITMIVSKEIIDYDSIYYTHVNLRKLIEDRILFAKSSIIFMGESDYETSHMDIDLNEFKSAITLSKDNKIKSSIDKIIIEIKRRKLSLQQVKNILNYIVIKLHECYTYENNQVYEVTLVEEMIVNTLNYDELRNALHELLQSLLHSNSYSSDKDRLAKNIKSYIDDNLNKPLTNQVLSQHFHLVPSYVSSIFKSHYGISSAEYIVNTRITLAKKLLKENPNMLTKDIAKAVGHADPLYFSKVFKKKTGVSPSKYITG